MSVCVASVCSVRRKGLVTIPLKKVSCLNVGLNIDSGNCFLKKGVNSGTLEPLILPRPGSCVLIHPRVSNSLVLALEFTYLESLD